MGVIDDIERSNQDAANLATVSGVSGLNIVGLLTSQLPGSTIDRGYDNLRHVSNKLQDRVIPLEIETGFYKQHERLFDVGLRLKEEKKALGRWARWKLYGRASDFETQTYGLRDDVHTSSDYYGALRSRRYTPSLHSVDYEWEVTSRPSSPALRQASATGESSSSGHQESPGGASTLVDVSNMVVSDRCLAGRLLATVEEELPEQDITAQEHIPLDIAVTARALGMPDDTRNHTERTGSSP